MELLLTILIVALVVEVVYKPRIDLTSEGDLLLWYGIKQRKYTKIITL